MSYFCTVHTHNYTVVDCGPLTNPANGQVNTSSGTKFGSTATYSCSNGHDLTGTTVRSCGAGGVWSLSEPVCEGELHIIITVNGSIISLELTAVDCGSLTNPDNGQVDTLSGTTFGSTATYSCINGYVLIGVETRSCEADGNWGSTAPTCGKQCKIHDIRYLYIHTVIECGPLTPPTNGQVDTSSGTTFGNTATYSCNSGYTLTGTAVRSCGADGMWTLSEPVCEGEI